MKVALKMGLAAAFLLSGCFKSPKAPEMPDYPLAEVPGVAPSAETEAVVAPLAFFAREDKACVVVGGLPCSESVSTVISSFLIRSHGRQLVIDPAVGADYMAWIELMPGYQQKIFDDVPVKHLSEELVRFHIEPDELDGILITHSHFDHVLGLTDLPQSTVYLPQAEVDHVAGIDKDVSLGTMPAVFQLSSVNIEPYTFDGPAFGPFERSHDLFGDASVLALPLPGHTPGGVGFYLPNVGGRPVLFVGDLVWNRAGLDLPAQRGRIPSRLADIDRALIWDSIYRVKAMQAMQPDLLVVPAHDELAWRELSELSRPWTYSIEDGNSISN